MKNNTIKDINIIKLGYDNDFSYHIDTVDYGVKYIGDERLGFNVREMIEAIQQINLSFNDKELTDDDIFLNYAKGIEQDLYQELIDNTDFDEIENFKTLEDFIDWDGSIELMDFLINDREDFERLCETNNCQYGTVGYSQWSHYVSWHNVEKSFVRDLWEGWNWYCISLVDSAGEFIDSVGGCYITDTEDLDVYVRDHFVVEDYYLIENEEAKYLDKPKVKEIAHVKYSYEFV